MLAIETAHLTKRIGSQLVVDDLALRVPEGSVYGFLGPNGAGKTTTMRMLLGLVGPDQGIIRIGGRNLMKWRAHTLAGVGAFIESAALYEHLSGRNNLDLTRRLLGLPPSEIDRVLEIADLTHAAETRVRGYSLGMKQRLALARALLGSPRLLLLDEPTNGLDPEGIVAMRNLIQELPDRIGGTVFVSSHLLAEIEQTAREVCLLRKGRAVLQGRVDDLLGASSDWDLRVERADAGAVLLVAAGMDARALDAVTIRVVESGSGHERVAQANRLLVKQGFDVSGIVRRKRSLEDLYRATLLPHAVDGPCKTERKVA